MVVLKKFELDPRIPLTDSVRHAAISEIERSRQQLVDAPDGEEVGIHEFRQGIKRLRGLLRLLRADLDENFRPLDRNLRDAARLFAERRDQTALVETAQALRGEASSPDEEAAVDALVAALVTRPVEQSRSEIDDEKKAQALALLEHTQQVFEKLRVHRRHVEEGLKKTYRVARHRYELARDSSDGALQAPHERAPHDRAPHDRAPHDRAPHDKDRLDEALHDLRKYVKYHRYQLRLLRPAFRPVLNAERKVAKKVSDLLGDDHDLVLLGHVLPELDLGELNRSLLGALIAQKRHDLGSRALSLCQHLLQEKPKARAKRLRSHLDLARTEHR